MSFFWLLNIARDYIGDPKNDKSFLRPSKAEEINKIIQRIKCGGA